MMLAMNEFMHAQLDFVRQVCSVFSFCGIPVSFVIHQFQRMALAVDRDISSRPYQYTTLKDTLEYIKRLCCRCLAAPTHNSHVACRNKPRKK